MWQMEAQFLGLINRPHSINPSMATIGSTYCTELSKSIMLQTLINESHGL